MADTIINKFGTMTGWNKTTMNVLGRDLEGITELEYNDEQEIENVYGAGTKPIGEAEGNYSAQASVTLHFEEQRALLASLKPGQRIQDIPAFPIVVVFEVDGVVYRDVIRHCRFKNNGVAVKQNDKTISHKYDLKVSSIDWNV